MNERMNLFMLWDVANCCRSYFLSDGRESLLWFPPHKVRPQGELQSRPQDMLPMATPPHLQLVASNLHEIGEGWAGKQFHMPNGGDFEPEQHQVHKL